MAIKRTLSLKRSMTIKRSISVKGGVEEDIEAAIIGYDDDKDYEYT
ncbi:hypothetical protein F8M41_016894, partial [Gigaspora margarita]